VGGRIGDCIIRVNGLEALGLTQYILTQKIVGSSKSDAPLLISTVAVSKKGQFLLYHCNNDTYRCNRSYLPK
jgi:hypothetical protein